MREPNEQAVLDHACNTVETLGERFRIGNPLECGIENPVPAVRDESVAILGPPQQGRPDATDSRGRGLDRAPRRCLASSTGLAIVAEVQMNCGLLP